MKFFNILPLAVATTALVLPEPEVMQQIAFEDNSKHTLLSDIQTSLPSKEEIKHRVEETFSSIVDSSKNAFDDAFELATNGLKMASDELTEEYFDAKSWMASALRPYHHHRHDSPPHDGPHDPHHDHPPHHEPGHDKPHHPPHHKPHESNQTVYELIASSKYTTKLAELINEDSDLVKLLNGTSANFTVFAPTDEAFSKIPEHHKKPTKDLIKKVLSYHISGEFYPAGRILVTRTVPTLLGGKYLSSNPDDTPQRLSTNIGLRGLTVNFYSRVVAANIFGTNGVIHGVDSLLLPPPSAARIVTLLPSEFSTLELALRKTDLWDSFNTTEGHLGGTLFAPTNFAFKTLGPKVNAFLFSEYGSKYLKALLQYHTVVNQTLYSDAYYSGGDSKTEDNHRIPKGKFHIDLPTLLKDHYLSVDIARFGRLIDIRINGFTHVSVSDGVAKDGVIQALSGVLIPPKKVGEDLVQYQGEDLTVEDLKQRLEPFAKDEADKHDL